jgi:hypothetical protein
MKSLILFGLIFLSTTSFPDICENDQTICSFYCKANTELSCHQDNYLMSFGYKYCHLFLAKENSFNPSSQQILSKIRTCLIQNLSERADLTCENVEQIASNSHISCYLENNFCQIELRDKLSILSLVQAELKDPRFRNVMGQISKSCFYRN